MIPNSIPSYPSQLDILIVEYKARLKFTTGKVPIVPSKPDRTLNHLPFQDIYKEIITRNPKTLNPKT